MGIIRILKKLMKKQTCDNCSEKPIIIVDQQILCLKHFYEQQEKYWKK